MAARPGFRWRGAGSHSSRASEQCAHSVSNDRAGQHLSLFHLVGLRIGDAHLPGAVTAHFTLPQRGTGGVGGIGVELPEGLSVEGVEIPA